MLEEDRYTKRGLDHLHFASRLQTCKFEADETKGGIYLNKRNLRAVLILSMVFSMIFLVVPMKMVAADAVSTDLATKDVFLNVDSDAGYNTTDLANAVKSEYLRLGGTASDLRITTNSTAIDTTDLSGWYVYDHYDPAYWNARAATLYSTGKIATNSAAVAWQYDYAMSSTTDAKRPYQAYSDFATGIIRLQDNIAAGAFLGNVKQYDQHIYSGVETSGAFMTFVGYGSPAYTDFLFYPDTLSGTKTVTYTIDSTNVVLHSMTSAGFLINTGIDDSGNIKGYILVYGYSSNTTYTLNLYPIKTGIKALDFSSSGAALSTYYDAAITPIVTNAFTTGTITDVQLTITPSSLKVEQKNPADVTYSTMKEWTGLASTSYNGFGPYVKYSGHGCYSTSSYKFTNLTMSSATVATTSVSAFASLRNSDYLIRDVQKYFVNILGPTSSYDLTKDINYLLLVQDKDIDLYTNKSVTAISAYLPRSYVDTTSATLAAYATSIANYLLGNTSGTVVETPTPPVTTEIVANFSLTSGGKQVSNIMREQIPAEGVIIDVINETIAPSGVTLGTPTYKLTSPSGAETVITMPFTVTNNVTSWPSGRYKVTMSYGGTSIPAEANFYVLTDATVPTVAAVKNGNSIDLTFTNTASPAGNTYTSNLAYYVIENTSTTTRPTSTWINQVAIINNATSASVPITQAGYMHILVKDVAGNIGHTYIEITQIFPTITAPVAANISYGQSLGDAVLSGGVASNAGTPVAGTFAWVTPSVKPVAGVFSYQVRFTPTSSSYATMTTDVSVTVDKRDLSITSFTASSKVYDATTVATADPNTWTTDAINGDAPKFTYTANFDTATNGTNKTVSFNASLTADAVNDNYSLITPTGSALANISKRPLTITLQDKNKTYGSLDPVFSVTYDSSVDGGMGFAGSENATTLGMVVLYRLSGNDVGFYPIRFQLFNETSHNYDFNIVEGTFEIKAKTLTITSLVAQSKTYDGDANTTGTIGFTGVMGTDEVFAGGTFAFADKHAGLSKLVNVSSITLTGAKALNYAIGATATTSANITPKALNLSAFSASNKVYDGTTAVTGTGFIDDRILGDDLVYSFNAALESKNVADSIVVNYTNIALSGGADQLNYVLATQTGTTSANITAKAISATASAADKVYDGVTAASGTISLTGVASGDDVTASGNFAFEDKNVGSSKTVNVTAIALSGDDAANYTVNATASTTASITKRTLTMTAENKSKLYQEPFDPEFTIGWDGFQNNETEAVLTGSYTIFREVGEESGNYDIWIISSLTSSNYTIIKEDCNTVTDHSYGTFTIEKRVLTATVGDYSKVYGDGNPSFSVEVSGFVNGETTSTAAGFVRPTASSTATVSTGVGNADITISGGSANNYTFNNSDTGTLTIHPKALSVTAVAQSKVYGSDDPALTFNAVGFVNGDSVSLATGGLTRSGGNNVNTYSISLNDLSFGANYSIDFTGALLTITKAELTVTAEDKSKVYGAVDPALTFAPSGTLYYGDAYTVITGVTLSTNTGAAATAGTHTIAISGGTANNYNVTHVAGTLSVAKAELTVTANSKSKVYGAVEPTLTYTPSGTLYYGDAYTVITGVILSTDSGSAATAGNHTIAISGGIANNYNVNHVNGNLSVTKAELTVTADAQSKVYGAGEPTLTYTPSGTLYYTDGYYVINGVVLNTSTGAAATVGNHPITISGGTSLNYNISHIAGNLSVAKAELTVTADDKSKVFGAVEPTLTYTPSGTLYYGDAYTVITGVMLSTNTGAAATAGTHTIAISGGTASNYNITHTNGTLSVAKAELTVTADAQNKVYGAVEPTLTYTPSGTLYYGDSYTVITGVMLSTNTGAAATAGNHTIAISGGTASNYNITHTNGTLSVAKAELTVTADAQNKVYGAVEPTLTYTPSGTLYYGDAYTVITVVTLSTNTGAAATAGTHTITISGGTASNYNITHTNGTLSVAKAALTVTADVKNKIVGENDPVFTYRLTSGQLYGTDTFSGQLQREPGTTVRSYEILQGTLTAGPNYQITYIPARLYIADFEDPALPPAPPVTPPTSDTSGKLIVIINGNEQSSGTETTRTIGNITQTTLDVESQSVNDRIDQTLAAGLPDQNVIEVVVTQDNSNRINTVLTGDIVKRMEVEKFEFRVTTNNIQYSIDAAEMSIDRVAQQLGVEATELQNIQVEIQINKIDEQRAEEIRAQAQVQNYEILFAPVEFTINATSTDTTGQARSVSITTFSNYVERVMEIPEGVDPTKITTGIVYNQDGTFSHIPTAVFTQNGKWFARLNSLTNSTYSVIWNPVTVASVENHWSKDIVNDMASRLVIGNPETFTPDGLITRGEFAEYITKALGIYRTGVAKDNVFNDVTKSNKLADAITIASKYGIINGYLDGSFRSDSLISRTEAMVMYARAMNVAGLIKEIDDRVETYEDKDLVASWAYSDVRKVISAGVFNGVTPTLLAPLKTFTYAESATAVRNLLIETLLIDKRV